MLPSDERVERGDEGRKGSVIPAKVQEVRGEIEECKVGGGCCHVSAGKREFLGGGKITGSPLVAVEGMAKVLAGSCVGDNASGA